MTKEEWIEAQVSEYRGYLADTNATGWGGADWIFSTKSTGDRRSWQVVKPTLDEYRAMMINRAERNPHLDKEKSDGG